MMVKNCYIILITYKHIVKIKEKCETQTNMVTEIANRQYMWNDYDIGGKMETT